MDVSRMANIAAVNHTTLTRSSEQRTENKTSTLASEHTDSFIRSQQAYTPAYTKSSAQKQNSDNNLLQRENAEDKVGAIKQGEGKPKSELVVDGVRHIIRAMLVKQGEVLSGSVPSVGAMLYAEELLAQIRQLYGNTAADENTPEYWAAEPTSERLMLFFECVSTDEDKSILLERAFTGAFNETEELFGGRGHLPLASYETKALVQQNYFDAKESDLKEAT